MATYNARSKKKSPIDAYKENVEDALWLVRHAEVLTHTNKNTMQSILRTSVGNTFHIPKKNQTNMDYIQNDEIILIFRDKTQYGRKDIANLQPLLRPAVVAVCAAFETYLADRVMTFVGPLLRSKNPSSRLKSIPLTAYDWMIIEQAKNRGYAMRNIVERYIRENSSTAPKKVGELLSLIGVKNWTKALDSRRRLPPRTTESQLDALTDRRNRIAHAADRKGRSRNKLTINQARDYIAQVDSIVDALEGILTNHKVP